MAFLYPVTSQVKNYVDSRDGSPLNGTLRFGVASQDPEATTVEVYWDVAGTQPAPQPIRVRNGFALRGRTPANVFANGDFSAIARDTRGRLVYTVPNSADIQLALSVTGLGTAAAVGITDAGGFFTGTNVEAALQEVGVSLAAGSAALLAAVPTGVCWPFCGTVAPSGFVLESGQSIGNASSGAVGPTHQRANADALNLFTLLWNSSTNTELPIQDSAGVATTRGASAANDFAANKRLPTPDGRGKVQAGKDNMGGTTLGLITAAGAGIVGTTQFATGGTQTHTLTTAQLAAHTHAVGSGSHTHTGSTMANHTHTGTTDNHTHAGSTLPDHSHTVPEGGGHIHPFTFTRGDAVNCLAGAGNSVQSALTFGTNVTPNTAVNTGPVAVGGTTGAPGPLALTISTNTGVGFTTGAALSSNVVTVATASSFNTGAVVESIGTAHQNTQPTIMYTRIIRL